MTEKDREQYIEVLLALAGFGKENTDKEEKKSVDFASRGEKTCHDLPQSNTFC